MLRNVGYVAGIPDIALLSSFGNAKILWLKGFFIGHQNGFSDIDLFQYISFGLSLFGPTGLLSPTEKVSSQNVHVT